MNWIATALRIDEKPRRQWMVATPYGGFVPHPGNAAIPWTSESRAEALQMAAAVRGGRVRDAARWIEQERARRAESAA